MLSISTAFFNVSKRNSWAEVLSERPYLINVPLQVIEAHPKSSPKDIEHSIALLKEILVKN